MRIAIFAAVLGLILTAIGHSAEVIVDGRTFRVPDGFIVEKVAGPPLVDRPIVADFDELGRLYVADSSGSNANVKTQVVDRPHRIVRLEDSDGDGTFDRSVVFADKMMFPEGAMWLGGSLYVAAPPSIWKLTDTDGDGVADRREEWFQGKTLTGCANDLHGPYSGLDGRIYWCKGAFGPQTYERPGRKPLQTRAAHIFRAKPDGTEIEPVMNGGMDNPVDVAFTPEGERIFTTTFLQHPGGGKRDGLIHALYGGLYGKDHDVLEGHPRTGLGLLPPLVHLGPAAPAGLVRVESDALVARNHLFAACFNLRKVTRHKLTPQGGSFSAETQDFLASDDLDFHPTDVQEDADGSLLVVDTGGWYKICCPTSQLVKPDVLGAIYRVRRRDALRIEDPRGLKLDWASLDPDALIGLLNDPRHVVARRAIVELAGKPLALPAIVKGLQDFSSTVSRRNAVWAASRIEGDEARAAVRLALGDRDPSVCQAAAHSSGLWRDRAATERLIEILKGDHAPSARAAAEALGRIGPSSSAVVALLRASDTTDFALRHSATYALIEIDDPRSTRPGLASPSPMIRRAALMALEQMEGGNLGAEPVITSLSSTSPELRAAAWWVAARHPEWGEAVAGFVRSRTRSIPALSPDELDELETRLASMASSEPIQQLIATDSPPRFRAMARSGLKDVPKSWVDALTSSLRSANPETVRQAVATARALPIPLEKAEQLITALLWVAGQDGIPTDVQLAALAAIPNGPGQVEPTLFAVLARCLDPDRPASERTVAADVLARSHLSKGQLIELTTTVASAGPLEMPRLLEAFDKVNDEEVGLKLVEALKSSPSRSSLRVETLKPRLARFGSQVGAQAGPLYEAIESDSADRRGHLEGLLASLKGGDVRRGQAIFNGSKAACVTCHAVGYVGGKLGPDLTRIGEVRSERDLLESIVYPSASFVRSYEPMSVATRDGRVFTGLLRKEASDEVILAISADRDERIVRDQIEEMKPGTVSVMPAGLDRQLSAGELADLIAFLKACR